MTFQISSDLVSIVSFQSRNENIADLTVEQVASALQLDNHNQVLYYGSRILSSHVVFQAFDDTDPIQTLELPPKQTKDFVLVFKPELLGDVFTDDVNVTPCTTRFL
jgi:hypothetical protein